MPNINPSYQKSFFQPCKLTSSLNTYLAINSSGYNNNIITDKTVLVFPNMEYEVVYYDAELGSVKSLIGLVMSVCEDSIKIKYSTKENSSSSTQCGQNNFNYNSCNNAKSNNREPMPSCGCILNPPDNSSKYEDIVTTFIPVQNIISISYKKSQITNTNYNSKPEEEVRVMILGISATAVKSIIIRLKFFDDCIEDAVKYVDLAVGGIYDIAFENPRDNNTIYEFRGKLESIEEYYTDDPCKPGRGFVRQSVCMNNSISNTHCSGSDKQDFMNSPPAKQVKLIFDTSEDFSGRYEYILLTNIRDCTQVRSPIEDNIGNNCDRDERYCHNCKHMKHGCNIHSCGHYNSCKVYRVGKYNVHVNGDKITIDSDTMNDEITMNDLLKFYLGVG